MEIILGVLILLLTLVVGVAFYLILRLKSKVHELENKTQESKDQYNSNCNIHKDRVAKGVCAICSQTFCEMCLIEHDNLNFCRDHIRLYMEHDWETLEKVKTFPEIAHESMHLYNFKDNLWSEEIPTIVSTHYQINLEGDRIESEVSLLVPQKMMFQLKERYQNFKRPD